MILPGLLEKMAEGLAKKAALGAVSAVLGPVADNHRKDAVGAFDAAAAAFFQRYGDEFGTPAASFLASEANLDAVLRSTLPTGRPLSVAQLNREAFADAPAVPEAAAALFVAQFLTEVERRPVLSAVLAQQRRSDVAGENWERLIDRVESLTTAADDGPATDDLRPVDRERWMRYLRRLADRIRPRVVGVHLDVYASPTSNADASLDAGSASARRRPMASFVRDHPALLLLAPPGAGKSNAALALLYDRALDLAAGPLGQDGATVRGIPVFVEPGPGTLLARIAGALHSGGIAGRPLTEGWVRQALAAGALWVVVDDAHRFADPRELDDVASYVPESSLLALGRSVPALRACNLPQAEIAPLTDGQQEAVLLAHLPPGADVWAPRRTLHALRGAGAVAERPQTLLLAALAESDGAHGSLADRRSVFERAFHARMRQEAPRGDGIGDPAVLERVLGAVALHTIADRDLGYRFGELDARAPIARTLAVLKAEGVDASVDLVLGVLRERHLITDKSDGRLGFEHDQWHEYFAAAEVVRTRSALSVIPSRDSRREVARFVATAPVSNGDEGTAFQWSFWHDLILDDLEGAVLCSKAAKAFIREEGSADSSLLSSAEQMSAYRGFLHTYTGILSQHVPRLRLVLPPRTEGQIGLRVFDRAGAPEVTTFKLLSLVALDENGSAPDVQFADGHPSTHQVPGASRPNQAFSVGGFPSRAPAPALVALHRASRGVLDALRDRALWEPDALLCERAFYEAAALAASVSTAASTVVPAEIVVSDVLQRLLEEGISPVAVPPRRGAQWKSSEHLAYDPYGPPPHTLTVTGWRRTLAEMEARGMDASVLRPPVVPPIETVFGSRGPYSKADLDTLTRWSVGFFELVYQTVHAFIEANFPTTSGALHTFRLFPATVVLVPLPDPLGSGSGRTTVLGEVWVWPTSEAGAPLVRVHAATPATDVAAQAAAAGRGSSASIWNVPAGRSMPLYDAVYDVVEREIESFLRP